MPPQSFLPTARPALVLAALVAFGWSGAVSAASSVSRKPPSATQAMAAPTLLPANWPVTLRLADSFNDPKLLASWVRGYALPRPGFSAYVGLSKPPPAAAVAAQLKGVKASGATLLMPQAGRVTLVKLPPGLNNRQAISFLQRSARMTAAQLAAALRELPHVATITLQPPGGRRRTFVNQRDAATKAVASAPSGTRATARWKMAGHTQALNYPPVQ